MSLRYRRSKEALARLMPEQHRVTQEEGTQCPSTGERLNKAAGIHAGVASGEPLLASSDKFESGTGWPSIRPILCDNVAEKTDLGRGMRRVEVRSKHGEGRLGYVFPDGLRDAGVVRYCINSAPLRFVQLEAMEAEGYGDLLHLFDNADKETAR